MQNHWALTGQLPHLDHFLFQPLFWYTWNHFPVTWPNLCRALARKHFPLEWFGVEKSLQSTQWLSNVHVFRLQTRPKSSRFHYCVWQLAWHVCSDVLCFLFCPNIFIFPLLCPKHMVPDVLLLVQMQHRKLQLCSHVLFRQKRLSPGNFPK